MDHQLELDHRRVPMHKKNLFGLPRIKEDLTFKREKCSTSSWEVNTFYPPYTLTPTQMRGPLATAIEHKTVRPQQLTPLKFLMGYPTTGAMCSHTFLYFAQRFRIFCLCVGIADVKPRKVEWEMWKEGSPKQNSKRTQDRQWECT